MKNPLVFVNCLLCVFILGIFCAGYFDLPLHILYGLVAISFLSSGISLYFEKKSVYYGILLLFFLLGFLRCIHGLAVGANDIGNEIGQSGKMGGRVVDTPRVQENGETIYIRYVVEAETFEASRKQKSVSGKVVVQVTQKPERPIAQYGDKVLVRGEFQGLHGYQNPGLIDTVAMLQRQGITAKFKGVKDGVIVKADEKDNFYRVIDRVRNNLRTAMEHVMPKQDAALLFAMLFGGYEGIKPELVAAFTATGIIHILSVSGSHIALLAATMQKIADVLRLRPAYAAIFVSSSIIGYAVFSGCVPPVIRSAAMGIITFVALALKREKDSGIALAFVGLIMLAVQPQLLYDISFQLSFTATGGLLYLSPIIGQFLVRLNRFIAINLSVTIAAQCSVLPFLAWYFNGVSVSALLANLIAVPIIEVMIILGLAGVILGFIFPIVQKLLFVACSMMIGLVYYITSAIAAIPGGFIYIPTMGVFSGLVYYLVLVCGFAGFHGKYKNFIAKYRRFYNVIIVAFGILFCITGIFYWQQDRKIRLHFIDVGQGDAMLLTTARGKAMLIDTGGVLSSLSDFDVGERVVVPYLKHYGVREVEYLLLTHVHEDHAGGAAAILRHFPVKHIIVANEDRQAYASVFKTNLQKVASFVSAYQGQTFILDGVRAEVLQAMDVDKSGTGNEVSNVIKLTYGKQSFLITGDLDANGENELLKSDKDIESTVLKVGHHGSKTSSTQEFIQKVSPSYAVVSVGANNKFGHPHKEVLERLAKNQIKVFRTDQLGAIIFTCDGQRLDVDTFIKK